MPRTPDAFPGVRVDEGTIYEDEGVQATEEGEMRYTAGTFSLFDSQGEFNPRGLASVEPNGPLSILYSEDGVDFESVIPLDFLLTDDGRIITLG